MEDIEPVIEHVISENKELVEQWLSGKPGSWGGLAGKAVVAARSHAGRSLTSAEKRIVWQALWDRLVKIKTRKL